MAHSGLVEGGGKSVASFHTGTSRISLTSVKSSIHSCRGCTKLRPKMSSANSVALAYHWAGMGVPVLKMTALECRAGIDLPGDAVLDMGIRVHGMGYTVWGTGYRAWGDRVQGIGYRA